MERVAASGAVVEVCPTSNRRIGNIDEPDHHPVHRLHANGVPFVVSSDDPGIFGTKLADELDWVVAQLQAGPQLREELIERAWRSRSEVLTGRESL
jgi:adenosine deaminase